MQPNQPQYPQQLPNNFDFTQNQPQPPASAPVVPQVDPNITQLQSDIAEIKTAISGIAQPQPTPEPTPTGQEPAKKYDEWGAVFDDVDKRAEAIVDQKLAEREQAIQTTNQRAQEQEQQNQQYIDNTVTQLRGAGYLPPITNQFDPNDPGKQAETELIGYAVYGLGSTDLSKAAQELKFRHDAGFKFDPNSKQFVQVSQPNNDPNSGMFGNLPVTPDQSQPQFGAPPQMTPQYPQQMVGPQNPYMPPQYPPGFNAPVSSGNSFQGTQGGVPALRNIRSSSYDALVEQFNRTQ